MEEFKEKSLIQSLVEENHNLIEKQDVYIDTVISKLQNFIKQYDRYPKPEAKNLEEKKLANQIHWIRRAKVDSSIKLLNEERIKKLDAIGFIWFAKKQFDIDKFIAELQQFIEVNGRYPTRKTPNASESKLAQIVSSLRRVKAGKTNNYRLTDSMIKKLDSIGFIWDAKRVFNIDEFIKTLSEFIEVYNRYPSNRSSDDSERRLASHVNMLRNARKGKGTIALNEDRIKKLDAMGFIWGDQKLLDIDEFINNLSIFINKYNRYPDCNSNDKNEVNLAEQVSSLRLAKKVQDTNRLTNVMVQKLDAIGFEWEAKRRFDIDKFIENLQAFISIYDRYPSKASEDPVDKKLGTQVRYIRQVKKGRGVFTAEMESKLNAIGFEWEAKRRFDIDKFIENLQAFISQYDKYPSKESGDPVEKKLGAQVHNIRQAKKGKVHTRLTNEMIQKLNAIGFVWEARRGRPKKQEESIMQK